MDSTVHKDANFDDEGQNQDGQIDLHVQQVEGEEDKDLEGNQQGDDEDDDTGEDNTDEDEEEEEEEISSDDDDDFEPFDWYENPIYYDIIFQTETERECSFLESVYERYVKTANKQGRKLLEPACGTGRLCFEMAKRGYDVRGFDLAAGSVEFAQRLAQDVGLDVDRFFQADMTESCGDRCEHYDIAVNLVSSFKHILTEEGAIHHLRLVSKTLKPGGCYVLGIHLTEYDDGGDREKWIEYRDGVRVIAKILSSAPDRQTRLELLRVTIQAIPINIGENSAVKRMKDQFLLRTYDVMELFDLVVSVSDDFVLVSCFDFDFDIDQPRSPRMVDESDSLSVVLVLRKPMAK